MAKDYLHVTLAQSGSQSDVVVCWTNFTVKMCRPTNAYHVASRRTRVGEFIQKDKSSVNKFDVSRQILCSSNKVFQG